MDGTAIETRTAPQEPEVEVVEVEAAAAAAAAATSVGLIPPLMRLAPLQRRELV